MRAAATAHGPNLNPADHAAASTHSLAKKLLLTRSHSSNRAGDGSLNGLRPERAWLPDFGMDRKSLAETIPLPSRDILVGHDGEELPKLTAAELAEKLGRTLKLAG